MMLGDMYRVSVEYAKVADTGRYWHGQLTCARTSLYLVLVGAHHAFLLA